MFSYNLVHYFFWFNIVAKYANLPFIPPFLQPGIDQYYYGVNFASAGAGALVETYKGDVSILLQWNYFRYKPYLAYTYLNTHVI